MLNIINGRNIEITRGNVLPLTIKANNKDQNLYEYNAGDVIRFKIMKAKKVDDVVFQKDFKVEESSTEHDIVITAEEMKIGELSSKPVDYWYEVELNPDTPETQTIIGFTKKQGAAIITILPEGGDK